MPYPPPDQELFPTPLNDTLVQVVAQYGAGTVGYEQIAWAEDVIGPEGKPEK